MIGVNLHMDEKLGTPVFGFGDESHFPFFEADCERKSIREQA
jgi:hypothetical protein